MDTTTSTTPCKYVYLPLRCTIAACMETMPHGIDLMQQYAELQNAYELEEDSYWVPATTLSGIKAQMHQKTAHSFELQPESVTLLEELGKGECGMVHKGEWVGSLQGPLQVAVKSLHSQEEENRYKLLKEAAIMGQFNHPYVVRLYGVIDKPNKVTCLCTNKWRCTSCNSCTYIHRLC